VFLLVSQSVFALERSHKRRRSRRNKAVEPAKNKWYQLFQGVMMGASKTNTDIGLAELNLCFPSEWGIAVDYAKIGENAAKDADEATKEALKMATAAKEAASKATDNKTANEQSLAIRDMAKKLSGFLNTITAAAGREKTAAKSQALNPMDTGADPNKAGDAATDEAGIHTKLEQASDKSTFEKVMDVVQKIVDFTCKFKDKIKGLFSAKYKKYMKNRKMRNFVERKRSGLKVSSKDFWDDVTGFFKDIGNKIESKWEEVTDTATWIFGKLKEKIQDAVAWAKKIYETNFVKKIIDIVNCVIKYKGIPQQLVTTATGIYNRIELLTKGVKSVGGVFIDWLCNVGLFREAFKMLDEAKAEKDNLLKWRKFGHFVGKLLYGLGN